MPDMGLRYRRRVVDLLERASALRADMQRLQTGLYRQDPLAGAWLPCAVADQDMVARQLSDLLEELDRKEPR